MITRNDFIGMLGKRIQNEMIKDIIRRDNPQDVAARKCDFIDWQEKFEHFTRFWNEYNEWMVQQQMVVQEYLREYNR